MNEKVYLGSFVSLLAGFCVVCGCDFREPAPSDQAAQTSALGSADLLKGGKEVFRADFEGPGALDPAVWNDTAGGGGWRVENGVLHSKGTRNKGLWLRSRLPTKVRLEFDARSESLDGDIKFEIFTDGKTHESGYIGVFGGWKNSLNIIARLDEHGKDRCVMNAPSKFCGVGPAGKSKVKKGQTYRMAIVRVDHVMRWYVDGVLFLEYVDSAPLKGSHFGFNNWAAPLYFDNVVVYDLGG